MTKNCVSRRKHRGLSFRSKYTGRGGDQKQDYLEKPNREGDNGNIHYINPSHLKTSIQDTGGRGITYYK